MVMKRIPGTDRLFPVNRMNSDVVIEMDKFPEIDSSLKYEDVQAIGERTEWDGTVHTKSPQEVMFAGVENTLSIEAKAEGDDLPNLNVRGKTAGTHFRKPRMEVI